jgi:hypothetical protein
VKCLVLSNVLVALFLAQPLSAYHSSSPEPVVSGRLAMPRQPIKSSNISSIGYDAASSTLEVEFTTNAVYQYYNVPRSVYEGLMNAKSHGSYLAHYVKDAGYRYKEVQ